MAAVKHGDRVTVRDTPGRWWLAGDRTDLLTLAPDDADAVVYLATSVHPRVSCMSRWPEDVEPVTIAPCSQCGTWPDEDDECHRCGQTRIGL